MTPTGAAETGVVDVVLAKHGLARRVAVTVPSFFEAAHIASMTELVATLPARLAHQAAWPVDVRPPPCELPPLAMMLAWHPSHASPALTWVREQLALCATP